jgi:hypothetical protein
MPRMAKPLVFRLGSDEVAFGFEKVDRAKLYGYKKEEALDEQGRPCELAPLCPDGKTLVAKGGRAIGFLSQGNEWLNKAELQPVDFENKPITPVPSSFAEPIPLAKQATIDDYLKHNIKSVYVLDPLEGPTAAVLAELGRGAIYTFPYSFRGGLVADVGFLLANPDGVPFLCVGQPTEIHFVGFDQLGAAVDDGGPDAGDGDDDLDFGMM